jgi:hypothetical protein
MWQFTLDRDCKAGDVLFAANGNSGFFLDSEMGRQAVATFDDNYSAGSVICVLIRPDGRMSLASGDPAAIR